MYIYYYAKSRAGGGGVCFTHSPRLFGIMGYAGVGAHLGNHHIAHGMPSRGITGNNGNRSYLAFAKFRATYCNSP